MKGSIFSFIRGQACSGWDCVYSQDFLVSSFVQTWQSVSEKFIGIPLAINNSKVIWIFCLVLCWYPILASHYPFLASEDSNSTTKLNHSWQGAFKAVHHQNKLQKLLRLDKKKTELWVTHGKWMYTLPNLSLWRCQPWVSVPHFWDITSLPQSLREQKDFPSNQTRGTPVQNCASLGSCALLHAPVGTKSLQWVIVSVSKNWPRTHLKTLRNLK